MNTDISSILDGWPYEPGQISCRMVPGADGELFVQIRLDLGLLQLHADGRPDGQKPFGFPSLLDYYEDQLDTDEGESPMSISSADEPDKQDADKTSLTPEDCRLLREEAEQYYRRYIALLVLEDYERVIRDTSRNLRVLDLCNAHAETDQDKAMLEQFRPYITMMRTRALASQALKDEEPKAAIHALDEGLEALRRYFAEAGTPQMFEKSNEVEALRGMRDALVPKLPVSQRGELKERLARAIADENYELAAILRDELKQLKESGPG